MAGVEPRNVLGRCVIDGMTPRNLLPKTQPSYLQVGTKFGRHFGCVDTFVMLAIELGLAAHRLQWLTQPALPEVPGADQRGLTRRACEGPPAHTVVPCRAHRAIAT